MTKTRWVLIVGIAVVAAAPITFVATRLHPLRILLCTSGKTATVTSCVLSNGADW